MAVTGSYWQLRLFTLSDPILDIVDKNNIIIYIILLFLQYIILDNLLLDYNVFRHPFEKYVTCFYAVVNITQVMIDAGHELYQV